jgi:hypothetical protein
MSDQIENILYNEDDGNMSSHFYDQQNGQTQQTQQNLVRGAYFEIFKSKFNSFLKYFYLDKRTFKCPYGKCGRLFKEKGNLKTHIRIHVIFKFIFIYI